MANLQLSGALAYCAGALMVSGSLLPASGAPEKVQAWVGGTILTGTGQTIDDGVLLVEGGKILAVGPEGAVAVPEQAVRIQVAGKVIIPGLIDTHSHVGVGSRPHVPANADANEMTDPVQTAVRAMDAFNPHDPGIQMAVAGGITSANVMPGSGNVIGGQTIYVKFRGSTVDEMMIRSSRTVGGLKMANGENPKRAYGSKGKAPGTRMKTFALQRQEFTRARDYQRKWDVFRSKLAEGKEVNPPEVDLGLETLVEVLQNRRTVHFHSHRADDIRSVLRLKDEFGFDLVLQHGTEAYRVADELAKRNVPVSMTVLDSPGGKAEVTAFTHECGKQLADAGVKVLINTDDWITESRFFLRTAALVVGGGLDSNLALQAVTLNAAQALRLDDHIGSLEPGKDADFVLLSGPPFSIWTRVLQTYIDGEKVFDLEDDLQRRYQCGGFALPDGQVVPRFPLVAPGEPIENSSMAATSQGIDETTRDFWVVAREIYTGTQGTIRDGVIHVKDGTIRSISRSGSTEVPPGMPVLYARAVTPGLIDAFSSIPLTGEFNIPADQDVDEKSDPNQADLRVLDAFNPAEPLLYFLLSEGVTVVHVCPGQQNVLAGVSGVFKTTGATADEMVVRFPQALVINLGEVPKQTYPDRRPGTRMGTAALIRGAFAAAANYQQKIRASKAPEEVESNLKHRVLLDAMDQRMATLIVAQRSDDLVTGIRLAKEYDLRAILGLAAEAYLISGRIKEAGYPLVLHPTMQRAGGSMETLHSFAGNAAVLDQEGVPVAITSAFEGYVPKTRVVRREAALAMVYGMGFEKALASITINAAKILQIDDRYGSLEPGKVADLVLYDGHPFETSTHVTHVIASGALAFDRAKPGKAARWIGSGASAEPGCCLSH